MKWYDMFLRKQVICINNNGIILRFSGSLFLCFLNAGFILFNFKINWIIKY